MLVLALETATEMVGAAVVDHDGLRASTSAKGRRQHAELLGPAVEHVCQQAGIQLHQVELLAVDTGPGLFTGLRVGVAMANGLAVALSRPVVGVSSLEALALGAVAAGWRGEVMAVVDAKRGEVFMARFAVADGSLRTTTEPVLATPDELRDLASSARLSGGGEMLAVGDGVLRYWALLDEIAGLRVGGGSVSFPSPELVARAAGAAVESRGLPEPAVAVEPVYLRAPDVRIGWTVRPAS